jgi:hypothetical protein
MKQAILVCCVCWGAALAQDAKITSGPVDYQVYQRGADGRAVIHLAGEAGGRAVEATLAPAARKAPGWDCRSRSRW